MNMKNGSEKVVTSSEHGMPVYSWVPGFDIGGFGDPVGRKNLYHSEFITFDIETSTISKDLNIMYIWQMCIRGEYVIIGRYWEDALAAFKALSDAAGEVPVVCYVHNLAYEFQYLRGLYDFALEDVFLLDARKPVKARIPGLNVELRCSYKLSNRSLAEWTRALGVPHGKMSGELDYTILRTPKTILTPGELAYCVNDVVGLWECVRATCEREEVNMATIPLTSTGFVRRECKKALQPVASLIKTLIPSRECLKLLLEAIRGGDTHASRYYAGTIVSDLRCFDISSSYPFTMTALLFPMSPFRAVQIGSDRYIKLSMQKSTPTLARIQLREVRPRDALWGFPYLARAKCKVRDGVYDNGRIVAAELVETCVTDVDFRIIHEQYLWESLEVLECWVSTYGQLPSGLRAQIVKYFVGKTSLKGVQGGEVEYAKSKNRINAVYGMTVQNPLKPDYLYEHGEFRESRRDDEKYAEYEEKGWLPYQWGVWVCAHARSLLQEALRAVGHLAVYCDTDSVFFEGGADAIESLNAWRKARAIAVGGHAIDPKGCMHYMGVFEPDKECARFISWGAKKYAYETPAGKLVITIAGVGKLLGAAELEAAGGLSAFRPGYIFHEAAGNCWYYNDIPACRMEIDGEEITVTPNISALPTTYEVSISEDYAAILEEVIFSRSHEIKNL